MHIGAAAQVDVVPVIACRLVGLRGVGVEDVLVARARRGRPAVHLRGQVKRGGGVDNVSACGNVAPRCLKGVLLALGNVVTVAVLGDDAAVIVSSAQRGALDGDEVTAVIKLGAKVGHMVAAVVAGFFLPVKDAQRAHGLLHRPVAVMHARAIRVFDGAGKGIGDV